ncbi:hypothetical protein Vadar_016978 [Vaccinium darrowii]|uniref:Uncharacterized protein n=1 Tax=Vaccinium darrowii TaxID=229202 RepID=A0ACB7XJ82_9ERIC|nr:hypothetical protein Vadar_016978 [Vaccinium darrowii]
MWKSTDKETGSISQPNQNSVSAFGSDFVENAGLNRSQKSCRLRWLNYLRPDIKRGDFGEDEDDLIIRLHRLLGNRQVESSSSSSSS